MENFKKLLRLAKRLELKYITASQSAQSGDIEKALYGKRLTAVIPGTYGERKDSAIDTELSTIVTPLLTKAGIKNSDGVDVTMNVSPGPKVTFNVMVSPTKPAAAKALSSLLSSNFSAKAEEAIRNAGLEVSSPVTVHWLKY